MAITIDGTRFERAAERIREYCEVEVYKDRNYTGGYDDRHNITDSITAEDLESANNLYAEIRRADFQRIINNPEIPLKLSVIKDLEIGNLTDEQWRNIRGDILSLVAVFVSVRGVDLAKTTKVLHLKRPRLLPPLDSLVVKFLTGNDMEVNRFSEDEVIRIGRDCMEIVRADLVQNRASFDELQERLVDLPIPLTMVRLHNILCWTQQKWVKEQNPRAKYGTAVESLNQSLNQVAAPTKAPETEKTSPPTEIASIKEFRRVIARAEGVIVITTTRPPRAHSPLCDLVSDDRFVENTSLGEGKKAKYYWSASLFEARRDFGAVGCKRCRP
ncbi:MAG TPA: DUF6308 family protein [Nitrososphaerales archaeon]|nr:DUF6308 family protein [Nitrososphaerales archaeon]